MAVTDEHARLSNLENRVKELETKLEEVHRGVVGSIGQPGIAETLRTTAQKVDKVVTATETLMADRWLLRGVAAAMGAGGAGVGWLINHFWGGPSS